MVIFNRKVVDQQPLDFSTRSESGTTTDEDDGGSSSGMKRVIDLHLNPDPRLLNFSHHQNGGLVSSSRDRVPGDGGKMSRLRSESPPTRASISPPHHRLSHHHHHHHHHPHHNHHNHRNSSSSNDSRIAINSNSGNNTNNSASSPNNATSIGNNNATNALNAINSIPNSLIPLIPNPAMLLSRLVMPVAPGSPPGSESPRHNDSSDEDEGPKDFRGKYKLKVFSTPFIFLLFKCKFSLKCADGAAGVVSNKIIKM